MPKPMMSKIQRHILKHITPIFRLSNQGIDEIAQVALVLRLGLEHLRGHLHDVGFGVVAGTDQFDQLDALGFGEGGEVARAEFEDDFLLGGVGFAYVGCVAEAEGLV